MCAPRLLTGGQHHEQRQGISRLLQHRRACQRYAHPGPPPHPPEHSLRHSKGRPHRHRAGARQRLLHPQAARLQPRPGDIALHRRRRARRSRQRHPPGAHRSVRALHPGRRARAGAGRHRLRLGVPLQHRRPGRARAACGADTPVPRRAGRLCRRARPPRLAHDSRRLLGQVPGAHRRGRLRALSGLHQPHDLRHTRLRLGGELDRPPLQPAHPRRGALSRQRRADRAEVPRAGHTA